MNSALPSRRDFFKTVLVPAAAGWIAGKFSKPPGTGGPETTAVPSAFERLMERGVLRCAYLPYSIQFRKDPNTGKLSGVFHDLTEELGRKLGLRVEWIEGDSWATMFEGFKHDRYDLFATGIWESPNRARVADFTMPVYFDQVCAYVRADRRGLNRLEELDSPDVKIATLDGATAALLAREHFPRARTLSLPSTVDIAQLLMEVSSGKADVTFAGREEAETFIRRNPGSLKRLTDKPVRCFANVIALPQNNFALKSMLDAALRTLHSAGTIERLLQAYEESPEANLRLALPYQQN